MQILAELKIQLIQFVFSFQQLQRLTKMLAMMHFLKMILSKL